MLRTELLDEPVPWSATSSNDLVNFRLAYWPDHENLDPVARQGYHIIIHGADELPSDSSFHFRQSHQHSIAVILPKQTLISEKVKRMSIKQRNCYLDTEVSLKLFKIYSKHNCEHECQSFAFAERCRCVPFYLLRKVSFMQISAAFLTKRHFQAHQAIKLVTCETRNVPERLKEIWLRIWQSATAWNDAKV